MKKGHYISGLQDLRPTPFTVPDGYFASVKERLSAISDTEVAEDGLSEFEALCAEAREVQTKTVSPWVKFRPYVALAMSFAVILAGGTWLLKQTVQEPGISEETLQQYSYYITSGNPYLLYMEEGGETEDELTSEEIEDYLILSGIPVENLYAYNYEMDY